MGVSYRFVTFLGFEVPLDFVWETTTYERPDRKACGHSEANGLAFCPLCGKPAPKMVACTRREIRPELGIDEDDIGNERIVRDLPQGMTVAYYDDMGGERIMLAGEILSEQHREDGFHTRQPEPGWNRESIESVLVDRKIPYDSDSYGIHVLVIAN